MPAKDDPLWQLEALTVAALRWLVDNGAADEPAARDLWLCVLALIFQLLPMLAGQKERVNRRTVTTLARLIDQAHNLVCALPWVTETDRSTWANELETLRSALKG